MSVALQFWVAVKFNPNIGDSIQIGPNQILLEFAVESAPIIPWQYTHNTQAKLAKGSVSFILDGAGALLEHCIT